MNAAKPTDDADGKTLGLLFVLTRPYGTRGPSPIWPDYQLLQVGISIGFDLNQAPMRTFGPYDIGVRLCR